jgi:hypothetical protein
MASISGAQIDLSDGRHVFYAEHEGKHYFRFRNTEGEETKFSLSGDATAALVILLTQPVSGGRWVMKDHEPDTESAERP